MVSITGRALYFVFWEDAKTIFCSARPPVVLIQMAGKILIDYQIKPSYILCLILGIQNVSERLG